MAAVRRVSLFEREIRVGLSSAAIEILFDLASVLSEGAREPDGYFGSTMITVELGARHRAGQRSVDASTVRRVDRDGRAPTPARARAGSRAGRRRGRSPGRSGRFAARFDVRVLESGRHLHIESSWRPLGRRRSQSDSLRDGTRTGA